MMRTPADTYGNSLVNGGKTSEQSASATGQSSLLGKLLDRLFKSKGKESQPPEPGLERIPVLSLHTLLRDLKRVDLLDIDIQGSELEVLEAAIDVLERSVARVHIAAHSNRVEVGLRRLFTKLGWTSIHQYALQSESMTPWGMVSFGDGVQSWTNPRLSV
jgi:hypothetical protein